MHILFFILITLACGIPINCTIACSAFVIKTESEIYLGKNFDWTLRDGIVIKNLQGAQKSAYFSHEGVPITWKSKYGSITFNQNGKEMPYGGMNEKGLVVEMLWLDETRFNISDQKPYLNELEWIQYQLDNFQSVQEVKAHLDELKIYPIKGKIHYILSDQTSESIIIEYLGGKPIVYEKNAQTCQAITNKSVNESEKYQDNLDGIRKNTTAPTYRYFQLQKKIKEVDFSAQFSEHAAFDMLKHVTIKKGEFKTLWSIVYSIHDLSIAFFSDTHTDIKTIDLNTMDFTSDLSYAEIHQNALEQPMVSPKAFTPDINLLYLSVSFLHLSFDKTLISDLSAHQFDQKIRSTSVFFEDYFHFEITIPFELEKQQIFLAIIDSEENFNAKNAVPGGFISGYAGKGKGVMHVYGLRNGRYALAAMLDENRNKELDFDSNGNPIETYATFGDKPLTSTSGITFENTSRYFDRTNAQVTIEWML